MTYISDLRYFSRKLVRELEILDLSKINKLDTVNHWPALMHINQSPNINISELAKILLTSTSSASRLVDNLAQDCLITEKKNKEDKREKYLELTQKGQKELKKFNNSSNKEIKNALHSLDQNKQKKILNSVKEYGLALENFRKIQLEESVKTSALLTSNSANSSARSQGAQASGAESSKIVKKKITKTNEDEPQLQKESITLFCKLKNIFTTSF